MINVKKKLVRRDGFERIDSSTAIREDEILSQKFITVVDSRRREINFEEVTTTPIAPELKTREFVLKEVDVTYTLTYEEI